MKVRFCFPSKLFNGSFDFGKLYVIFIYTRLIRYRPNFVLNPKKMVELKISNYKLIYGNENKTSV